MPNVIKIDGNVFIAREITGLMGTKLPAVTDSGGVRRATVGDRLRVSVEPPLFIGFPEGEDPHQIEDAFNVLTMWGAVMRGPQKQSPTLGLPSTFKIDGDGFYESAALGNLFVYGNGASSSDEPVHHFIGSTTTWTDSTVNADLTGDVTAISGMSELGDTVYMIGRQTVVGEASKTKITYVMTSLGVSADYIDAGLNENLGGLSVDRTRFAEALPAQYLTDTGVARFANSLLFTLAYNSIAPKPVKLLYRRIDLSSEVGYFTSHPQIPGTDARGLAKIADNNGENSLICSTEYGLYLVQSNNADALHEVFRWLNPGSPFTGRFKVLGNTVYAIDGPNLVTIKIKTGSAVEFDIIVDTSYQDGLEATAVDDLTAVALSRQHNWTYLPGSGTASTTNGTLFVFDREVQRFYGRPYRNATAQRAIMAIAESSQDDNTNRIHIVEEEAAGGDQGIFYFDDFTRDPRQNSSFRSEGALTMRLVDSDRAFEDRGLFKGWKYVQAIGDKFSSNEKLTPEYELDGGSKSSHGRDITTDGGIEWFNGATATGAKARRAKITWDLGGTAGTTQGPWVKAFVSVASIYPQTSGGNIPEKRRFLIDFRKGGRDVDGNAVADTWSFAGYLDQQGTANAWANLRTSAAKGTNITVNLDDKTSFAGDIVIEDDSQVRYVPEESQPGATLQIDGQALVSIEEVA